MKKALFFLILFAPAIVFCQNLSISQIYYDGANEWLGIKNNHIVEFSGSLIISGAKSSEITLDIEIPPNETYYITDSLELTGASCNYHSGGGLSLSDTKEIVIELFYGTGITKSFVVPEDIISLYNNTETILQYSGSERIESITPFLSGSCLLEDSAIESSIDPPIFSGYIIQIEGIYPYDDDDYTEHIWFSTTDLYSGVLLFEGVGQGSSSKELVVNLEKDKIYSLSDNANLGSSFTLPSISLTNGGEEIIIKNYSGTVLGSFVYTGSVGISPLDKLGSEMVVEEEENENNTQRSLTGLTINEIQPFSDGRGEYVEFHCEGICVGEMNVEGIARGDTVKSIMISLNNGELLVVGGTNTNFPGYINSIVESGLSLKDSGSDIFVYGQNGQLIDSGVYNGGDRGKSFNRDENGLFSILEKQTPGIDSSYFTLEEIEEDDFAGCAIGIQNKTPIMFPKKINPIVSIQGKNLSNSNKSYSCSWTVNNSYDGVLENCNPGYGGFNESGIHILEVDVYKDNKKICSTTTTINYPEEEQREPNRTNYYQGLYLKRKERYTLLKKELQSVGIIITGSGAIILPGEESEEQLYATGMVIISSLLPNPSGSDVLSEKIVIKNTTNKLITLPKTYIKRGTQKKLIVESLRLSPHEEVEYEGTLGLVNKASCIEIYSNGLIYDTFCYTQAQDDEWKYRLGESIEEENGKAIVDSNNYGLEIFTGSVCLTYDDLSLSCKTLPYNTEEVKVYKKEAGKFVSLEKKYTTINESLAKQKAKYKELYTKYKNLDETISALKKEHKIALSVRNDLIYYRKNTLQSERNTIYSSNGFGDSYNGFRFLLDSGGSGTLGSVTISSVKDYVGLNRGKLGLEAYDIKNTYSGLTEKTKQLYTNFLTNLTIK